ncbi:sensor histidine kinase, partial [Fulvivirga sp. RKSG066]|uniref:ligand-binding sensor domain-containing protein n=1 Tax=Fulvivirga aurantia TaxID=2529383 RepID=UPI0012BD6564
MKFFRLLMFLLCGLYLQGYGQEPALKFTHYGKADGLNQSSVNAIYQDSRDILWIANFGGINAFDGYTFKSYEADFNDSTSIPDNSVWTIFEDHKNDLWFGTKSSLSKYNQATDDFTNHFIFPVESSTLAIKAIYETRAGDFLVGTEGKGLFYFDKSTQKFEPHTGFPSNIKVTQIIENTQQTLWVATENLGLYKLSPQDEQAVQYSKLGGVSVSTIWSMALNTNDDLWIGSDSHGLIIFNAQNQSFDLASDLYSSYVGGEKIKTIERDTLGRMWIGSATEGLSIYDPKTSQFYFYEHIAGDAQSLYDNDVSDIHPGANGVVWLGLYMNGFNKVIETPFHTIKHRPGREDGLSNNNVYSMYRDRSGYLWFGTFGGGLNRYNPADKSFLTYKHNPNDEKSISHDWVRIIREDSKGNMWVGTWGGGLNKFNRETGQFERYLPDGEANSLNFNIVTAIHEDQFGTLWIGTYGGGINIYQPETDDFRSIQHNENDKNSLSDDHITSFYTDDDGNLWVCTYGGGINRFDYSTNSFKRFVPEKGKKFSLNNFKVLHIFPDKDSTFWWLTTLGGGVNKLYPKQERFTAYTTKDGLANNSTMGMLADEHGYWISTNNGLSYMNTQDMSFANYTTADGLTSDDYNLEAYAQDDLGLFYFGGKKGVTYFDPKDVKVDKTFPRVEIVNLQVDGKDYILDGEDNDIPYNSRVMFEFAAINPNKTSKISYAYKLKGLNDSWQYVEKQRMATFASLPPGDYQLQVKSTNGSGLWSESYSTTTFYIPPPWYMTWYFRVGVVVLLLIIAFLYYYSKIKQYKRQQLILEKKVEHRTQTIAQKNKDLEQSYDKLKKLEGFKESLVQMIAHDLKNPLVTILGRSEGKVEDENMHKINKSGRSMLRMIEDMLDVQKFESDKMKLNLTDESLQLVVTNAMSEVADLAEEKGVFLKSKIDSSYGVHIDAELIKRVLVNLLSNAIKFSPTGKPVEVSATKTDDRILIEVKDFGAGVAPELQQKIFEKYTQDKVKASGKAKSTGLGLPFCKLAVSAHGGTIGVKSQAGKGSTFHFDLAMSEVKAQANSDITQSKQPLNLQLSEEDLALLNGHKQELLELTIYETGQWYHLLKKLKESDSAT